MNGDARNRIGLVTLTGVLAAAAVVALLWLAAPMRVTLADDPPGINGEDAVNQGPTSQIWSPVRDAIIRQTEALTISGYAWEEGVEPPFLAEVPEVSVQRIGDWSYYVGWTPVISAESYIVRESETADFSTYSEFPSVDASDPNYISVTKESGEEGRYYYRVRATRFGMDPSRWSNVASVEVPWTETGTGLEIAAVANGTFTVEVRIDGGEWYTAPVTSEGWGGWSWAYAWTPLPEEQGVQHVIETRATNGLGEVGAVDAISVTVSNEETITYLPLLARRWTPVPYAPTLNAIDNTDKNDSYTVSWTYDVGDPPIVASDFTLQEDTNAGFTNPTEYTVAGSTSRAFSGKGAGVYYYRVRGNNARGPGEWSNVQSTEVESGFLDDFSSTSTGWPQTTYRRGTSPDGDVMTVGYTSGRYRMKILLDTLGYNNKRMGVVKSPFDNPYGDYDVEVDHYFERASDQTVDPTWGKGGLVFGANSTYSTIYVVEWHFPSGSDAPQCAVYKYNQVVLPTSIVWLAGGTPLQGWVACTGLKGGFNQTNRIRVEVRGSQATVYINSTKLGSFIDAGIASNHKVGLMTGSWERTPVESRFDNFAVTPR